MNSKLRIVLITVNTLALFASLLWTINKPDYEPIISSLVLIATLVGLWVTNSSEKNSIKQKQKSGKNSKNYQAGQDIFIQK